MSRPRAGHGWTWMNIGPNRRPVMLIVNDAGKWITTGHAHGWPRCTRCRRPTEASPFDSGLCPICYFYKTISVEVFWELHKSGFYLAPYNIGRRCMENQFRPTRCADARP